MAPVTIDPAKVRDVHLQTSAVVVDVVRVHGADHAQVVRARGQLRKQLTDFGAALSMFGKLPRRLQQVAGFGPLQFGFLERQRFAVVGRQPRLGVEQIHMGRPAGHEKKNDALGLGGEHGRLQREGAGGNRGLRRHAGGKVISEQAGQAQHAEAIGETPERLPPAQRLRPITFQRKPVHKYISAYSFSNVFPANNPRS